MKLDKKNWKTVSLGEIAEHSKESIDPSDGQINRYVAGEHMETDRLEIRKWGEIGDGYLGPAFIRRFHSGQVLYGSRRTYLRKLAVADFEGVCANTTLVLSTSNAEILRQDFLPFVMTSSRFHDYSIRESKGSVNPYVNWSDLAKFRFELPPPEQQESIANLLWNIESHQRILYKLIDSMDALLESFLRTLRNKTYFEENLIDFEIVQLSSVADLNWGDMQKTKSVYVPEGYLAYSASGPDGFMNTFDYDRKGIVLSAIGAESGKTWFASNKWSCIKNTMRIFSLDESKLNTEYMFWITNSKDFWPKRGSAQPFISQEDARKLKLVMPTLVFQLKTLQFIENISKGRALMQEELDVLYQVRSSILREVFEFREDHS